MKPGWTLSACGLALAALAGCATVDTLTSEVASFGEWPAGRAPGRYAFERLPSQQAQQDAADQLEQAARAALEKAGFSPVDGGQEPDVLVQIGARSARTAYSPWDDPMWWSGGFGYYRRGVWRGPSWGWNLHWSAPRYEREVALLIRDRASGKPLYETRAVSEGGYRADPLVFGAMFSAALADFPKPALSPRQVTVKVGS